MNGGVDEILRHITSRMWRDHVSMDFGALTTGVYVRERCAHTKHPWVLSSFLARKVALSPMHTSRA
jgi:hypothetical protein